MSLPTTVAEAYENWWISKYTAVTSKPSSFGAAFPLTRSMKLDNFEILSNGRFQGLSQLADSAGATRSSIRVLTVL